MSNVTEFQKFMSIYRKVKEQGKKQKENGKTVFEKENIKVSKESDNGLVLKIETDDLVVACLSDFNKEMFQYKLGNEKVLDKLDKTL